MEYLVRITFPEGQSQMVLVKAASAAAAEQAAIRKWNPGPGGSATAMSLANSGVGAELLAQYRNNPNTYLDASAVSGNPADPEGDLGAGGGAGRAPEDPNAGQMPKNPLDRATGDPNPVGVNPGDYGAQWRNVINQSGLGGGNALGQYIDRYAGQLGSLYDTRSAVRGFGNVGDLGRDQGVGADPSFLSFSGGFLPSQGGGLKSSLGFGSQLGSQSLQTWKDLLATLNAGNGGILAEPYLANDPASEDFGDLANVARNAARTKYGFMAERLPSAQELQTRFRAQQYGASGTQDNALRFLQQLLGI